jgi:hypothetical protein
MGGTSSTYGTNKMGQPMLTCFSDLKENEQFQPDHPNQSTKNSTFTFTSDSNNALEEVQMGGTSSMYGINKMGPTHAYMLF